MSYRGSWKIDDTLTFTANTHNPTNGSAQDSDSVPTYHVYEDETSTPLITGSMALLNGANTIGFYSEQITLSAANGFEKGKSYNIYIQAVVNSITGTMAHDFQIEAEVDANAVSDKSGYSLSSPQIFNLVGNITGTLVGNVNGSVQSVTDPVGINTGTFIDALVDRVWEESVLSHQTLFTFGRELTLGGGIILDTTITGSPTSTTFKLLAGSTVDDFYNDQSIYIVSGPGLGQVRVVLDYVGGATKEATVDEAFAITPSNGDQIVIRMDHTHPLSQVITGVWSALLPAAYGVGTAGAILGTRLDVLVSSRMPSGTVEVGNKTGFSLASPQSFDLIGNISGTLSNVLNVVNPVIAGVVTGSVLGNVNGSVNSVTNPVGISTGSFLNALADTVWDEQLSGHQAVGSAGKTLSDAGSAGDPWSTALPGSYTPGQAGHILASRMPTGTVLVGDKTGFSLASPQVFDLIGNISGTITNTLNVINPVTAGVVTGSVLGNVNGSVNNIVQPVGINTGTFLNAIADQVWDEQIGEHQITGSAGKILSNAGAAGDPWSTSLPGAYGAGTAGNIVGTRLDTLVSSRQPSGTVVVSSNQDKTGYSLATGTNLPVNVKQINDTNLTGNGSTTPWGPA